MTHALADPFPGATRRLLSGLIASAGIHLLIVAGIDANSPYRTSVGQLPLEVELRMDAAPRGTAVPVPDPPSARSTESPPPETLPEPLRREAQPAPGASEPPTVPDVPGDRYYTAGEVDARAEPLNEVHLVYPQLAYQKRISGKVMLRIRVDETGGVKDVAVIEATPPGVFEQAALTATAALQFRPARRHGRNVKSEKTIEVAFDPYESINIP